MGDHLATLVRSGLERAEIVFANPADGYDGRALAERGAGRVSADADQPAIGALLTNDPGSVELVLGAIEAGARLVSLPLPPRAADLTRYVSGLQEACHAHGVREVVARPDVAALLSHCDLTAVSHDSVGARPLARPAPQGFELVQFTSGSTGSPKGITVRADDLTVNILAILQRIAPKPGDVTVSWLPLSHDMGLIGMLLTSLVAAADRWVGGGTLALLRPEDFLRRPTTWLEALDHWRGTVTAAPDFAFRMATTRVPPALDLSAMRCAIVGGEVVRPSTLEAAAAALAPAAFSSFALCPAYGLAEVGVAATLTSPDEPWREVALDLAALADRQVAPARGAHPSTRLAASGTPLDGYRVDVAEEVGGGGLGAISVTIPAPGPHEGSVGGPAPSRDRIETGDLGLVREGRLYVCGRDDDHIVVHARTIYAPAVEDAIAEVGAVRRGRSTVVDLAGGEWGIAAEVSVDVISSPTLAASVVREIRQAAVESGAARPDHVALLRPGTLPMTSSGKVQRREVRRQWLTDTLGAQ